MAPSDKAPAILRLRPLLLAVCLALPPLAARADDLATARAAITKGDLHGAQITLRKLVAQDPKNGEAHYWLGRVSLDLGDPVAGEAQANAATTVGYDPILTARLLGQALLVQGKFDQVLATLQADGADPKREAIIEVLRGYALMGERKLDDAGKMFETAAQQAPDTLEPALALSRLALLRGNLPAAQLQLDRALKLRPKDPESLLAKAQLLRMQGHPNAAVGVLDSMLAERQNLPDAVQAHLDRASLDIPLGNLPTARADIEAVLAVTPGNVEALYLQAALAAQARDYATADARLTKIDAYLDRIPRAWLLVAMVKEQLGQLEQADTAAQRYIVKVPNDIAGYDIAARILFDKHRPDLVIKTLAPFAASGKADKGTYELLGGAYTAAGQPQQALEAYQAAQILAPDDIAVKTSLASLRVGIGQPNVAVTDMEHALAMEPKAPQVSEALFFAALASGDLNATANVLAKIKAVQGDTAQTLHFQGLLEQAQLDIPAAQQTFAALIKKYPDYLPAKISLAHLYAIEGHTEQADKLLTQVLASQPAAEPALTLLVGDDLQAKRPDDAVSLLNRAHAADQGNPGPIVMLGQLYIRVGTPQKALDLLAALPGEQQSRVELMSLKADAQLALGQRDAARATLTALLAKNPTDLDARQVLIDRLSAAGEAENAREVIKAGLAAMPRTYVLLQDYVLVTLKADGVNAALAAADMLQGQDQDFAPARALRGDVLMAANRPDDAIAAYAAAFAAAPIPSLLARLAAAQLRFHRLDAARATLRPWLDKNPGDLHAREQLAQVDIVTKRYDEAAESLRTILDERPHDPVALNNLAFVYQQLNDPRASDLARQAYELAPNPLNADTLGWILTNAGRADTGVLLLHQADVESEGEPTIRYHFAVAMKDLGQRAAAIDLLNTVITAPGNFPEKTDAQQLLDLLRKGS